LEAGALVHENVGNLPLRRVHRLDGELRPVADIFARDCGIYGEVFGMSEKDGGPAFPWPGDITPGRGGMTLRDYFAGDALKGMGMWCPGSIWPDVESAHRLRAEWAYGQADAMLEARKR
jgi:hypothetical protein